MNNCKKMIENKSYLLEKIYDKYKMEISRKGRLESKTICYYTILGIFFAAFLVIEPFLLEKKLFILFSSKEILAIINYLSMFTFLVLFLVSIAILHKNYKPISRPEFDPIGNWDTLSSLDNEKFIDALKHELIDNIEDVEQHNKGVAERLKFVNRLCVINVVAIMVIFFVYAISAIFKI